MGLDPPHDRQAIAKMVNRSFVPPSRLCLVDRAAPSTNVRFGEAARQRLTGPTGSYGLVRIACAAAASPAGGASAM